MEDYWSKMSEIYKAPAGRQEAATPGDPAGPSAPPAWGAQPRQHTQPPPTQQGYGYGYGADGGGGGRRSGSQRAARLTLTCLAASFAVLVVGLVVFFTVRTLRTSNDNPAVSSAESGPPATTAEDAARVVGGIGPPPGTEVPAYIEARKGALATVTGDRIAVVSLTNYATEAQARVHVGSAEVVALLAAAPNGQPMVVTTDIAAWAAAQTAEARAERDELNKLIPTVKDDPTFQSFYRSEVDRLNKLISGIRPNGAHVFGVVVKAPPPILQELGRKPEVRLVDVGPGIEPAPRSAYRGLRPEETARANEPNVRPV